MKEHGNATRNISSRNENNGAVGHKEYLAKMCSTRDPEIEVRGPEWSRVVQINKITDKRVTFSLRLHRRMDDWVSKTILKCGMGT